MLKPKLILVQLVAVTTFLIFQIFIHFLFNLISVYLIVLVNNNKHWLKIKFDHNKLVVF